MPDKEEMLKKMQKMAEGGQSEASLVGDAEYWSEIKLSSDILTDAVAKHVLGLVYTGMADVGETLQCICDIDKFAEGGWAKSWSAMAFKLQSQAEDYEANGHTQSAASAYLRASTYWRVMLMNYTDIHSPKVQEYAQSYMSCYERYLSLSGYPGECIEIPYEGTFLPGHIYRSPHAEGKAPLLVITPGRDTWAEDTRWVYDEALRRGIHCVIYDGPGQGLALRMQGLTFRPDWEHVVTPVLDYALSKLEGEVDPDRIGLMGMSFGGFLNTRAAAFDKRFKVMVADPGNLAWGGQIKQRLQMILQIPEEQRPPFMNFMLDDYAWKQGVPKEDVPADLDRYDNSDVVGLVSCNTLVLDGAAEVQPGAAKQYFEALQCPKKYHLFDFDSTAQCHCQTGGYAPASEFIMNWIEENL